MGFSDLGGFWNKKIFFDRSLIAKFSNPAKPTRLTLSKSNFFLRKTTSGGFLPHVEHEHSLRGHQQISSDWNLKLEKELKQTIFGIELVLQSGLDIEFRDSLKTV